MSERLDHGLPPFHRGCGPVNQPSAPLESLRHRITPGRLSVQRARKRRPSIARDQAGNEHLVRPAEADRRRRPECRIRRGRPRRRSCGHSAARLALRHPQLCRCRAAAGVGGLPGDRALSARLRHDALSFERHVPQWPAVGDRGRHHRPDGCAQDREGDRSPASTGARGPPTSSRRSGRSAARPWSR